MPQGNTLSSANPLLNFDQSGQPSMQSASSQQFELDVVAQGAQAYLNFLTKNQPIQRTQVQVPIVGPHVPGFMYGPQQGNIWIRQQGNGDVMSTYANRAYMFGVELCQDFLSSNQSRSLPEPYVVDQVVQMFKQLYPLEAGPYYNSIVGQNLTITTQSPALAVTPGSGLQPVKWNGFTYYLPLGYVLERNLSAKVNDLGYECIVATQRSNTVGGMLSTIPVFGAAASKLYGMANPYDMSNYAYLFNYDGTLVQDQQLIAYLNKKLHWDLLGIGVQKLV